MLRITLGVFLFAMLQGCEDESVVLKDSASNNYAKNAFFTTDSIELSSATIKVHFPSGAFTTPVSGKITLESLSEEQAQALSSQFSKQSLEETRLISTHRLELRTTTGDSIDQSQKDFQICAKFPKDEDATHFIGVTPTARAPMLESIINNDQLILEDTWSCFAWQKTAITLVMASQSAQKPHSTEPDLQNEIEEALTHPKNNEVEAIDVFDGQLILATIGEHVKGSLFSWQQQSGMDISRQTTQSLQSTTQTLLQNGLKEESMDASVMMIFDDLFKSVQSIGMPKDMEFEAAHTIGTAITDSLNGLKIKAELKKSIRDQIEAALNLVGGQSPKTEQIIAEDILPTQESNLEQNTFNEIAAELNSPQVFRGQKFGLTVKALDQEGNPIPDYFGVVEFSSSDSQAIFPEKGNLIKGEAIFAEDAFKLQTLGLHTITIETGGKSKTIELEVLQAPAVRFEVSISKMNLQSYHQSADINITVFDQFDNQVQGFADSEHPFSFSHSAPLSIDEIALPTPYHFDGSEDGSLAFPSGLYPMLQTEGEQTFSLTVTYPPLGTEVVSGIKASQLNHYNQIGQGSDSEPYLIYNAHQLASMSTLGLSENIHFHLKRDVDLTSYYANGGNEFNIGFASFMGVFDGNDHTVTGFKRIVPTSNFNGGIFTGVGSDVSDSFPIIRNVTFKDTTVVGYSRVGGLAPSIGKGVISRVRFDGLTIKGKGRTGGLAGYAASGKVLIEEVAITNFSLEENDHGGTSDMSYGFGGLIGEGGGGLIINKTHVEGQITLPNACCSIGGFLGKGDSSHLSIGSDVANSFTNVDIQAPNANNVGGLFGNLDSGMITASYSKGSIHASETIGGLVGRFGDSSSRSHHKAMLTNSYSTASITAESGFAAAGGLVGWLDSADINNSYYAGQINTLGNSHFVGGLIGYGDMSSPNGHRSNIKNSFALASLQNAGSSSTGFICGSCTNYDGFANNFYDADLTCTAASCSTAGGSDTGAEPSYFLNSQSNAPLDHWHFTGGAIDHDVWIMHADALPKLWFESEAGIDYTNHLVASGNPLVNFNRNLQATGAEGYGDSELPYLIDDKSDFDLLGNPRLFYKHLKLAGEKDSGVSYNLSSWPTDKQLGTAANPFFSMLDGGHNTLRHFNFDNPSVERGGLFSLLGISAAIKNLKISDFNVSSLKTIGCLAGRGVALVEEVTVERCRVNYTGSEDSPIGGLIGIHVAKTNQTTGPDLLRSGLHGITLLDSTLSSNAASIGGVVGYSPSVILSNINVPTGSTISTTSTHAGGVIGRYDSAMISDAQVNLNVGVDITASSNTGIISGSE